MPDHLLLESTDDLLLEDGVSLLLIDPPVVSIPFISSTTVVRALTIEPVSFARLSQVAIEALGNAVSDARVSQTVVEAIGSKDRQARVSQVVVEVLRPFRTPALLSQTSVEVLHTAIRPLDLPFIDSTTVVYALTLEAITDVPVEGVGPGNGGETWSLQLAPVGVTETATLAASIGSESSSLTLTGDGPFPDTGAFVVSIGSEVMWIAPQGAGAYRIGLRALSNSEAVAHSAGASVSWDDSYLMAVESTTRIAADYYDPATPLGGIGGTPTIGTDFPIMLPIAFETQGLENNDYTAGTLAAQLTAAGFRSVALQLDGATLGGRPHADMITDMVSDVNVLRNHGFQIIGWNAATYAGLQDDLEAIGADAWIPQVEGSGQRDAVIADVGAGVGAGLPKAAITNYGGIDTVPDGALLRAAGITALCVEVYAAEGAPHDDIDAMLFAGTTYGFDLQQLIPTLGVYAGEVASDYAGWDADVIPNFAIWAVAPAFANTALWDELEDLNDGSPPPNETPASAFVRLPGWIITFDSSQAYLAGNRYSTHVAELLGVFPAGDGQTGNKMDAAQPVAEHNPQTSTENCPVGIGTPSRIEDDIVIGDVALCRYSNIEASILTLGPRSAALQAWYGLQRRSDANADVTFTDPNGHVVDGSTEDEFFEQAFVTVTLDGDERVFTYGPPKFSNKGWPIAALAVRQGTFEIPLWTSPDWHNFGFVYSGFCDDCTFVQVLINRNDILYGAEPSVALPGPQDIDGPNASWNHTSGYYTSTAWYVGIFQGAYILSGPVFNGPPGEGTPPPNIVPSVPPGSSSPPGGPPGVPPDPGLEGGSGGGILPPTAPGEEFRVVLV